MPKLVLIDIQRDFFEGGASPLPQAEDAAALEEVATIAESDEAPERFG